MAQQAKPADSRPDTPAITALSAAPPAAPDLPAMPDIPDAAAATATGEAAQVSETAAASDALEQIIAARVQLARARTQCLAAPAFFLDQDCLPPWLCVLHARAEIYAQPLQHGRSSGPRRFLGVLPAGAVFPQMPVHAHWRLCVVPAAPDCVDAFDWPQHGDRRDPAAHAAQELAWQAAVQALDPLLGIMQDAMRESTGAASADPAAPDATGIKGAIEASASLDALSRLAQHLTPAATSPCMVDLLLTDAPLPLVQRWLQDCLSCLRDQRQPLPLADIVAANLAARDAALDTIAAVLHAPGQRRKNLPDGLACLAAEVAQAQGLLPDPAAAQVRGDETLEDWAARAGLRLRRVALRSGWWQADGLPLLGFVQTAAGLAQAGPRVGTESGTEAGTEARTDAVVDTGSQASAAANAAASADARADARADTAQQHQTGTPHAGLSCALLPVHGGYRWRTAGGVYQRLTAQQAGQLMPFAWSLHGRLPDRVLQLRDLLSGGGRAAWADSALLLLSVLAGGLSGALLPFVAAALFRLALAGHETLVLTWFAALIVALTLLAGALRLSADLAALRLAGRFGNRVQSALFDRLLRLPLRFFTGFNSADLSSRIASFDLLRRRLAGLTVQCASALCQTLGALAALAYCLPVAAVPATVVMLAIWLAAAFSGWRQLRLLAQREAGEADPQALLMQLLQGIVKLRLAGAEDRAFALWARAFAQARTHRMRGQRWPLYCNALLAGAPLVFVWLVFALPDWNAVQGADAGLNDGGVLLAALVALAVFCWSGLTLAQTICHLLLLQPLFERLRTLLDAVPAAFPAGAATASDAPRASGASGRADPG